MKPLWDMLATGGYTGKMPFAPGTWGTLPGVALLWFTGSWLLSAKLALALFLILVGVFLSQKGIEYYNNEDPKQVVIDEIAGVYVAGMWWPPSALVLILAFLAFRFFDILKPWPVNRAEALPGAFGIMADDIVAGIYAAGVLFLLSFFLTY
ncbi:phosphatidylglycerophosphatase A family protein [Chrysiogenes arsenatis]|uniref:phosphatidylglycerophosphatase A family protein n=1 Tax=Chrysiogenes arsenatis TaxID=309797 RepID=UPI00040778FB|nr:phosphatidylglycerophosphatase A [Chrysiogenes arsenatis]